MMWTIYLWLACGGVAKIPTKSDAWLETHLSKSQSIEHQQSVIEEMGRRRSPLSIPILVEKAQSPEMEIRQASLKALIAYGPNLSDDRRDKQYLLSLEDENRAVRSLAKQGISERLQSEVEILFLKNALLSKAKNNQSWILQSDILDMLQWVQGEDIDALCTQLSSSASNPQVRKRAIQSIATRKVESARPLLYEIAHNDANEDVRIAAKESLQQLGGKINNIVAAVMPFTVQGTDPNGLADGFQHYLSGVLSSSQVATIVERGQVDTVMKELIFQDNFIDDNQAIQIGQSLRASQVITGTVQFIDNRVTITIKRIDVASHEILSSAQMSSLLLDFDALQRDVSNQFIERF